MPVSETLSRKISVLSFFAIVGVVLSHHTYIGTDAPLSFGTQAVQHFCRHLTLFSVPFFCLMSGFWFAKSAYVQGESGWRVGAFWRKKARTLLVPYLLWSALGAILVLPSIFFHAYAHPEQGYAGTILDQGGFWESLNAIFGVRGTMPLANGPLWYVRLLLVFFLTAPLWRMLYRLGRWVPLLLGLACLLPSISWLSIPGVVGSLRPIGWLLLGMGLEPWIAENRRLPRNLAVLCGVVWLASMLINCVRAANGSTPLMVCNALIPFASIAFFWSIADWAPLYRDFMKRTFWVYCLHGPLVEYTREGTWNLLGKNEFFVPFVFFVMAGVTLIVCLTAASVVQRVAPGVYALLTGRR